MSETSSADHRGGLLGYVFIANCKQTRKPFFCECLANTFQTWEYQSHIGSPLVSPSSTTDTRTCDGGYYLRSNASRPLFLPAASRCCQIVPGISLQLVGKKRRVSFWSTFASTGPAQRRLIGNTWRLLHWQRKANAALLSNLQRYYSGRVEGSIRIWADELGCVPGFRSWPPGQVLR